MPGTASNRGLKDPFDPVEALPKSAELLSELKDHFGNLGLAAAAYNADQSASASGLREKARCRERRSIMCESSPGTMLRTGQDQNDLTIDLSADAIASSRAHFNRLSWESQLLATLQATSAQAAPENGATTSSASNVSTIKLVKTSLKSGEGSLCSNCIVQSTY